jgi:hypothetical protein
MNVTDNLQHKIDEIRAMDPADPNVAADHGPCRLNPGEDARLRRAKEEKVAESLRLKSKPTPPRNPAADA